MAVLLAFPKRVEDRIHSLSNEFYDAEDRGLSLADLFGAFVLLKRAEGSG
jgi:hypothetical protein